MNKKTITILRIKSLLGPMFVSYRVIVRGTRTSTNAESSSQRLRKRGRIQHGYYYAECHTEISPF